MAQVLQSPGLISAPTIESPGFVGAQPVKPDMGFTKYGTKPLETLQGAAKIYNDYQEEQRKKALEARVADASSEYYKRCMEKLVGKDGALRQQEYDVVKGYDGKSFTQYWGEQIDGIANDIVSKSADPELRQAFLKSIRGYRDGFYGQLLGHEGTEGRKYAVTSYKTQGDVASDQVSRGQNLVGGLAAIEESLTRIADLQGKNVNDKLQKEVIRKQAQNAYHAAFKLHLADVLKSGDVDRAMAAAETAVRAGALDGNAYNEVQTLLKEAYTARQAADVTKNAVARIREDSSAAGVLSFVAYGEGASDAFIDEILGEKHSLFGFGYGKNPAHTEQEGREIRRMRGIQAMDSLIVKAGGVDSASFYLAAGSDARAQELRAAWEKANSERDPTDQVPIDRFTWADAEKFMTAEEKAKQKRIAKAFKSGFKRSKDLGLKDYYNAAQASNPNASPEVLTAAAEQAKNDHDKAMIAEDAKKQAALKEAIRRFSSDDTSMVGIDMTAFTAEERAKVVELRRMYAANILKEDPELTVNLLDSPDRLVSMSDTDFELLRTQVSPEELNLLYEQRKYYKDNGGVGDGKVRPSDVKMTVDRWAYMHPEFRIDDDKQERARAEKIAYMALFEVARKRAAKDPLTQEEMLKVVSDRLSVSYSTSSGGLIPFEVNRDSWDITKGVASFGRGWLLDVIRPNGINILEVDGDAIGSEARTFLAKVFNKNVDDLRSEDYNTLFQKFVYDRELTIPKDALPEPKSDPDLQRLVREFMKLNDGKLPSDKLLCQMWLFKKAGLYHALERHMGQKTDLKPRIGSISYEEAGGTGSIYTDLMMMGVD